LELLKNNKMLAAMVLFDAELRDEVIMLMNLAEIKNYTQFVGLHGSAEYGKKEGSVAWPGTNEILFILISEDQFNQFKSQIVKYKHERQPTPGIFLFCWPLTDMV